MNKPLNSDLDYRQLWLVESHLKNRVKKAFDDIKNKYLVLRGSRPRDWPTDEDGRTCKDFINTVQKGIVFYCMEDLLWPSGRNKSPNSDVYWGSVLHIGQFHRCGENGTLELNKALRSRKHPGRQPVALRTYKDALQYHKAGTDADRLFPLIDERWGVRPLSSNSTATMRAILNPVILSLLYIHGKSASKIADGCGPEIRYVVGTKMVGQEERDLYAPPIRRYQHAFRRQITKLLADWHRDGQSKTDQPDDEWVYGRLGIWEEDDDPDCQESLVSGFRENFISPNLVVKPYTDALRNRLSSEGDTSV